MKYTLRIRNNGFRDDSIENMGLSVMSDDWQHIQDEIDKCIACGNIDFHVEVNQDED